MNSNLQTIFRKNESEKKKEYAERVIRIEHGTFTPIVLSAYGGYGLETSKFISALINKVADKHDLNISVVANYIRTKLSFHLVRSQVLCIRGSRTLRAPCINVGDVEFVQELSNIRTWCGYCSSSWKYHGFWWSRTWNCEDMNFLVKRCCLELYKLLGKPIYMAFCSVYSLFCLAQI